jgi:hypothetical protein
MNHCHETVDGLSATTLAALLAAEMERSEGATVTHYICKRFRSSRRPSAAIHSSAAKSMSSNPAGKGGVGSAGRRHHDLRMCDHGGEYLDCRMPVIAKLHRRLPHTSPAAERADPSPRPACTRGAEAARTLEREAGRPKATLRQSRGTGFDPGSYCL